MARYSIIMKDSTYVTLFQEASKHGKSLGKYLNELLNTKARELEGAKCTEQITQNPHCMTCQDFKQDTQWCTRNMAPTKATASCERYHR